MNTPSSQQLSGEEFKAIVRYETRNEPFKAEKVTIKEVIDKNGIECWPIIAFQEVVNEQTGSLELYGIHLYISKDLSVPPRKIGRALQPPSALINTAIYFKVLDKIPDPDQDLDTQELHLSLDGLLVDFWEVDNRRVQGYFYFSSLDIYKKPLHIVGHFNILNKESHAI